eukprot:1102651-Amphidinium_carterae.1
MLEEVVAWSVQSLCRGGVGVQGQLAEGPKQAFLDCLLVHAGCLQHAQWMQYSDSPKLGNHVKFSTVVKSNVNCGPRGHHCVQQLKTSH